MILQKFSKLFFLCFVFTIVFTPQTFAKKNDDSPSDIRIPRSGLSVKLRSKSFQSEGVLTERFIDINRRGKLMRVSWMSIHKEAEEARYPTYKIKAKKGIVEFDDIHGKSVFFHPMLWPQQYTLLGEASPLWLDPAYLELRKRKDKPFQLGLLKVKPNALKGLSPQHYEEILYFRNLYEHYEKENDSVLKTFNKYFFEIEMIRHTGVHVVVNSQSLDLPAKIFGNRYFQMIVLDQPDNPLILSLEFFPNKAPKVFKRSFDFLAKNFEFRITRIDF